MREDDPHAAPLAVVVRRALEEAGAVVEPILYDNLLDQAAFERGVLRDVERLLASHQPASVTFVGKSLGTRALGIICRKVQPPKDTRLVWLTPVWEWDDAWAAAQAAPWPSLYVVGLDDHRYHRPDRHAAMDGETVAIQGADHRLEVPGDIVATLDSWRATAQAVLTFTTRTAHGAAVAEDPAPTLTQPDDPKAGPSLPP
jgi:hypothetical protein